MGQAHIIIVSAVLLVFTIGIIPVLPFAEGQFQNPTIKEGIDTECRTGQQLVLHLTYNRYMCTSSDAAKRWESLGIAKIVGETEIVVLEKPPFERESPGPVYSSAELVFINGEIYTVDDENPWVQSIAIQDGKFVKVGSDEEARRVIGVKSKVIDLRGKMVLPSFIDTHQHWDIAGPKSLSCALPGPFDKPTLDSTRKKIEECRDAGNNFNGWFVGVGYSESIFPNGANKEFLDEIFPDRPAFLEAENGHDALVNSKGLEILEITKDSQSPPGGEFVKDPQTGEPTGRLIEDPASQFAAQSIPYPPKDVEFMVKAFKIAMDKTNENGITGSIESMVLEHELPYWEEFFKRHDLTVRMRLAIQGVGYDGPGSELYSKDILEMISDYDLKEIPIMVKVFADGTTEGHTVALLEPFVDDPNKEYDKLTLPDDLFKKVLKDYHDNNLQAKIHANGDRAVRVILDAIEEIVKEGGFNKNRHHIAHNALVHQDDMSRYRNLDVPAEWIPSLGADVQYFKSQKPILGQERWFEQTYPVGSLFNAGAVVAAGSDWPLTPDNVFFQIQTAVTRQDPLNPHGEILNSKNSLSLPASIQMYTLNGAYIMHLEDIAGSIEEGKSADFIIIDQNIFDVPSSEIKDTKVLQTFFEGKEVYNRN